jgi:hypothetical protein
VWHLLGWEEPLNTLWLRRSTGCSCEALVEFLLCWRVSLLPWLDRLGGHCCGHCVVVDPFDACDLVLGSILPHIIVVRCSAEPGVGFLNSLRLWLSLYQLSLLARFLKKYTPSP